jgi:phage terminase large subunit GpA-like protein
VLPTPEPIGLDFMVDQVDGLTDHIDHKSPVDYINGFRYLPRAVTPYPGYMNLDLTPYWIEPLNCLDIFHDAREISVKKGVKVAYNTNLIENGTFYNAGHLKVFPSMFVTADKELATGSIETSFIPMFQQSGLDIFQTSDIDNPNKTGKTKNLLQWIGGGYMVPYGGKNPDKARLWSIMLLFLDEIDTFPEILGRDGDPIQLWKDRCTAFWEIRKIAMGSTPLLKGASHIDRQYDRGDQRQYMCRCLKCGMAQPIRWEWRAKGGDIVGGIQWDYTDNGKLDIHSVRYVCKNCQNPHEENIKDKFINKDNCYWEPQADPIEPGIYSYHMPAMLSRIQPWHKCVSMWLDAYTKKQKVKSISKLQIFYNNVLGESFEVLGERFTFQRMSGHRRTFYTKGQVPNGEIEKYCQSGIMFLAMTVDVHPNFLAVAIWGFTIGGNPWLIDYIKLEDPNENGCADLESATWAEVQRLIDEQEYKSDDGKIYRLAISLIDSGGQFEQIVSQFCSGWESGVYPIKGDNASDKRLNEFKDLKTSSGAAGFLIAVDAYKDRMAPILRRDWQPEFGQQGRHQLNLPMDITDGEVKELTREYKKEKKLPNGLTKHIWHRPHGARNELWDLLIYAIAAYEILAHMVCKHNLELDETDFRIFWEFVEDMGMFYESAE